MIKNTFFGVFGPKIFKLKLFENVSQLLKTVSTIKFSILKLGSPPRCPVCCKKKSPIRAQCYLLSPYDNEQNSVVNKMKNAIEPDNCAEEIPSILSDILLFA